MKRLSLIIPVVLLVSITINSCTHSEVQDKYTEVHKMKSELIYKRISFENESLVEVNKETSVFQDGTRECLVRFIFAKFDIYRNIHYRDLTLNEEELEQLDLFLDSCINDSLPSGHAWWEIAMHDGVSLAFFPKVKSLNIIYSHDDFYEFGMSPKQLKEMITEIHIKGNCQCHLTHGS